MVHMLPQCCKVRTQTLLFAFFFFQAEDGIRDSSVTGVQTCGLPMEPAGEMWSVVTESPSFASTRAPVMSVTGAGAACMPSKYGGLRTYVDSPSQAKVSPVGVGSDCQRSSPASTSA